MRLLPDGWSVRASADDVPHDGGPDAVWVFESPDGAREHVAVDVRQTPGRSGRTSTPGVSTRHSPASLVIAPWLGPASAAVIRAKSQSYADATGNIDLALQTLPVVVRTTGASSDPDRRPRPTRTVGIGGAAALVLVRALVDASPPYTVTELARSTGLSLAHTSRLVQALDVVGLVDRSGSGITHVHWAELLRERARQAPPLLVAGRYVPAVARRGLAAALADLSQTAPGEAIVTGSFAASAVAPVTAPAQLVLRTQDPDRLREHLSLLPSRAGGNVLLLPAQSDDVTLDRPRMVKSVAHVALSQLVLDCLSGNGRLPAEGEEVLGWMTLHESSWRVTSLALLGRGQSPASLAPPGHAGPAPSGSSTRWTADALREALARLEHGGAGVQAEVVREAARSGGTLGRARIYELAGYPSTRSLRGFTRAPNRITEDLRSTGRLPERAAPLLSPVYDPTARSFQTARAFAVPESVVELLSPSAS